MGFLDRPESTKSVSGQAISCPKPIVKPTMEHAKRIATECGDVLDCKDPKFRSQIETCSFASPIFSLAP